MDPIEADEVERALSLTGLDNAIARRADVANQNMARREAAAGRPDAEQNSQLEYLRSETHRFEKGQGNNRRWVDVTAYDYSTDELVISVVNLNNNKVMRTERHSNMQPPLSANELDRALDIVFNDSEERALLNAEFLRITGQELTSTDQLEYKAFTFFADSMPDRVNAASKRCGAQRCSQLLLFTHENVVFEISPIVNLSEGLVTQRLGY